MFIDDIKQFIRNNPQIYAVTPRGLETITGEVVFRALDLDTRYPELKEILHSVEPVAEPVIEESVEEAPKKRTKKK